jgi:hypothetical protein
MICRRQTHFLHSCLHEGQIVQWVEIPFGHNSPHVCIGILYSREFPLSRGHCKLEKLQNMDWFCHLGPCVHWTFVPLSFHDLDKHDDYV